MTTPNSMAPEQVPARLPTSPQVQRGWFQLRQDGSEVDPVLVCSPPSALVGLILPQAVSTGRQEGCGRAKVTLRSQPRGSESRHRDFLRDRHGGERIGEVGGLPRAHACGDGRAGIPGEPQTREPAFTNEACPRDPASASLTRAAVSGPSLMLSTLETLCLV